jgi:hypothetical protein
MNTNFIDLRKGLNPLAVKCVLSYRKFITFVGPLNHHCQSSPQKPEGWSQFLQAATAEELSEESSEAKEESDEDQKLLLPQRRSNVRIYFLHSLSLCSSINTNEWISLNIQTNINPILTELEMLEIKPLDKWNLKVQIRSKINRF